MTEVVPNIIPRPKDDICWRNFLEVLRCFRALNVTLPADFLATPAGLSDGDLLTWDAGTATVVGSVPPAPVSPLTTTETELDFGSSPVAGAHFTVTDASVSGTSKIMVMPSGNAPTGGYSDTWEWDSITFAAKAGTGSFTVYASVGTGTVSGKYKVFYTVA